MNSFWLSFAATMLLLAGCDARRPTPEASGTPAQTCNRSSFGIEKVGLCADGHCPIPDPPKEIQQIRRGIYVFQGNTITGDWVAWAAVDLDLGRVVRVDRYRGYVIGNAQEIVKPSDTEFVRESEGTVELVDITALGEQALDEVSCDANKLWTDKTPRPGKLYDYTIRVGLRDGAATKVIGGQDEALSGYPKSFVSEFSSKYAPARLRESDRLRASMINGTWFYRNDRVFFEAGSSKLSDPAKAVLDRWAFLFAKSFKDRLTIEGHTDDKGSVEFNRVLGLRRAEAVKDYLIAHGLDAARIATVSYGKQRPVVLAGPNGNVDAARVQNRRAVGVLE